MNKNSIKPALAGYF